MILVLADTPLDAREISGAVGGSVRVVDSTRELTAEGEEVETVIVGCRSRRLRERIDLLARLERERPWVPVVLVTDPDPDVAKLLVRVRVSALVWFPELRTRLQSRLDAARATAGLFCLAESVGRSELPRALRRALAYAVRQAASRPVRNVRELAEVVGCTPVTLFQQFGAHAGGETTLARFLGGLAILRVHELRRSGLHWKCVTARTGIRRATVNRRVRTWPGCTFEELGRIAPDQLFRRWSRRVRPRSLPVRLIGLSRSARRSTRRVMRTCFRVRRGFCGWTAIVGSWALLLASDALVAAVSLPLPQEPVLELEEVRTHPVPPGVIVAGAALSEDGDRLLAWSVDVPSVLLYDGSGAEPRTLPAPGPVVGGRFLSRNTAEMVHSDGTMSHVAWDAPPTLPEGAPALAEARSAVRGWGGWWLLVRSSSADGTELHFVPDGGMSDSTFVAPLWPSTDRIFLAIAGVDALVSFRDPPHTVWRIAMNGDVVASMQLDQQSTGGEDSVLSPNWLGLSALYLDPGVIQVIADVTTDRRLLVTYDTGGGVLSHRLVAAPFGFVATASQAPVMVALRTFEDSELVVYSWRWRVRDSFCIPARSARDEINSVLRPRGGGGVGHPLADTGGGDGPGVVCVLHDQGGRTAQRWRSSGPMEELRSQGGEGVPRMLETQL
ncbi:hypothetical protein [Candidatus Palauibacter sp.]|uniref:hypothetical protein n=1 Tax=Candidatus Palauibacter sp. TaxID=3101350 RepID=UPI003B520EC1